jgi:Protein of unknown function (Hypoth_ymh)
MYNRHPFEANRTDLVVLRTRLSARERMAAMLGPSGPQLSTASLHPTIWHAAADLFDRGHFRQAVQTAGQALESHLQAIAGPTLTGQDLAKLFSGGGFLVSTQPERPTGAPERARPVSFAER